MKKANTNKMLLATVVAVITVLFGFAAVGTSVVGPGVVPPPPPEPTPEPEYLSVYVDIVMSQSLERKERRRAACCRSGHRRV